MQFQVDCLLTIALETAIIYCIHHETQYDSLPSSMDKQLTFIQQKKVNRNHTYSSCTKFELFRCMSHYTGESGH